MADLNYHQEILIGDQVVNVERQEVLSDRSWSIFKTVMVYIGGILVFWTLGFNMFACGQSHPDCRSNCQPTATTAPAPTSTGTVVTVPGIERLASAIEKVADAKPPTATASATSGTESTTKTTSSTTTVVVKIPGIDRLASAVEKLDEPPTLPPTVKTLADPMVGMTPKERCDYEIIKLRRTRCQ